jgi:hypothetical protein
MCRFSWVYPAVIVGWGHTLRTVLLMSVHIGAVVALAIYLGPRTNGTLATLLGPPWAVVGAPCQGVRPESP